MEAAAGEGEEDNAGRQARGDKSKKEKKEKRSKKSKKHKSAKGCRKDAPVAKRSKAEERQALLARYGDASSNGRGGRDKKPVKNSQESSNLKGISVNVGLVIRDEADQFKRTGSPALSSESGDSDSNASGPVIVSARNRLDSDEFEGNQGRSRTQMIQKGQQRRKRFVSDDSNGSMPRRTRADSDDSDMSVPRRPRADSDDSDISVPRRPRRDSKDSDISVPRRKQRVDSDDSDISVPRRPRRDSKDSDISVPRRKQRVDSDDSDISVPRRPRRDSKDSDSASSSGSQPRMESGVRAGLKDAASFKKEQAEAMAEREMTTAEAEAAAKLEGRGVGTVYRNKDGRQVDMMDELNKAQAAVQEKAAREKQLKRDFNTGSADKAKLQALQVQLEQARLRQFAVKEDDEQLNEELKAQLRPEDPMAALVAQKRQRASGAPSKKVYQGPPAPPNRFGIRPGYRWDGVDRGNGFERRLLASISAQTTSSEKKFRLLSADM